MRLAGLILRIALLVLAGASGTFALDLVRHSTHFMLSSTFALVYMYVASILIALLAGLLTAFQIIEYLYPEPACFDCGLLASEETEENPLGYSEAYDVVLCCECASFRGE